MNGIAADACPLSYQPLTNRVTCESCCAVSKQSWVLTGCKEVIFVDDDSPDGDGN